MTQNDRLNRAVKIIFDSGFQIHADAFNLLKKASESVDPELLVNMVLEKIGKTDAPPLFIDKAMLEEVLHIRKAEVSEEERVAKAEPVEVGKGVFHPYAKDVDVNVDVLSDPSEHIASTGSVESFTEYFRDRFQRLQKMLKQRLDVKDSVTIGEALSGRGGSKVKIIGMVCEKTSRERKLILRIDDLEHSATVLVQPSKVEVWDKAQALVLDEVVCVVGVRVSNELIVAEDLLLPDVPQHKPSLSEDPVNAVLMSDFHVGSKAFEKTLLERFLLWINGKIGSERQVERAGRVKYIVIAGDIVDGIGVYPQQEQELEIKDIYKQYELAARFIERIPDYVKVIIIPGNHDASRKALPQPSIPRKYAEPVYEASDLISLGNPAQVRLHGVNILIHHGRSLEDILAAIPGLNHQTPAMAMVHLLKMRHLAPVYGQRTPIAPEPRDWMVLESIPDIYHAGHIHILDRTLYRGVHVVNSGCWQRQTGYQKKMGVTPVYGIVPVADLQTMTLTSLDFTQM